MVNQGSFAICASLTHMQKHAPQIGGQSISQINVTDVLWDKISGGQHSGKGFKAIAAVE